MDKALVFGTKDCRFESCQGHIFRMVCISSRSRPWNLVRTSGGFLSAQIIGKNRVFFLVAIFSHVCFLAALSLFPWPSLLAYSWSWFSPSGHTFAISRQSACFSTRPGRVEISRLVCSALDGAASNSEELEANSKSKPACLNEGLGNGLDESHLLGCLERPVWANVAYLALGAPVRPMLWGA